MRYNGAPRQELYDFGFVDQDIDRANPVLLMLQFVGAARAVNYLAQASDPPAAHHAAPEYTAITVQRFAVDGPSLARSSAHVRITGQYVMQGGVERLYLNDTAVVLSSNPQNGIQPSVPLLTGDGSHEVRSRMQACQQNPGSEQIGCPMTVSGAVVMCTLTSAFGGTREEFCLNVEAGQ